VIGTLKLLLGHSSEEKSFTQLPGTKPLIDGELELSNLFDDIVVSRICNE
jgi:hypothetical protein